MKLKEIEWDVWVERAWLAFVALVCVVFVGFVGAVIAGAVVNESSRIAEGVVIDKEYNSAYTTYNHIQSDDITIRIPQYHSETFSIRLEGTKDGETVTYWKNVTEQEYADYDIGDWYPRKG